MKITAADQDIPCTEYSGDVIVDPAVSGQLDIKKIESIGGSLKVLNASSLQSISSSTLTKVDDSMQFIGLAKLSSIDFRFLKSTKSIKLANIRGLSTLSIGSGAFNVSTVEIRDTGAKDLSSVAFDTVDSLYLTNNKLLTSYSSDVQSILQNLEIASNGDRMAVSFPKLEKARISTISGVASFKIPVLKKVQSLYFDKNNQMESVAGPNLTEVGLNTKTTGSLSFTNNTKLVNVSFPAITNITGDLTIATNDAFQNITGFPKLQSIYGSLVLGGNFSEVDLPKLNSVSGSADIRSFADVSNAFCDNEYKKFNVKGANSQCKFNSTNVSTGNGTDIGKDGKGGSSNTGKSAGALNTVSFAAMSLALLGGALQLL